MGNGIFMGNGNNGTTPTGLNGTPGNRLHRTFHTEDDLSVHLHPST